MCCAQVWPGQAVFPDYLFNPNTYKWLKEQLAAWHQAVPFDGLWLDMNEPASFCEGQFCAPDPTNETSMHCECHGGGGAGAVQESKQQQAVQGTRVESKSVQLQ